MRRAAIALASGLALVSGAAAAQETLQLPHEAPPEERKAAELTRAPGLVTFVPAVYPPEAEKAGLQGDVGLELDLGADGKVSAVRVTHPAGRGFDEAASAAAKRFVFTPAEIDHKPAPVTIDYVYHFVLRKVEAPKPPPTKTVARVPVDGRVLERASKKPIGGATVRIAGVAGELGTKPDGTFHADVPTGPATFQLFSTGYEPLSKVINVFGKKLGLTFYLRSKIEGFHTVVRTTKEQDVVEQYTLDREEVRRAPGTFGDPLHIITDLPGVARSPFDLGFLVVRGADPEDTDFYLDGIQVPLIYHFGGGPAVVNPEFLDKIDFYPGGQGAQYGHAIGGTVDVTSRQLETDRIHAVGDVNTDFASGFAEAPVGWDTTVAVAGRRSYFDLLLKPFLGSGVVIVPYFWDYQLKIDHGKKTDRNTFSLMLYGSDDILQLATGNSAVVPGGFTLNYFSLFHHLVLNWTYKRGRFKSSVSLLGGYEDNNIGASVAGVENVVWVGALRHNMSFDLTKHIRFDFGEDVSYGVTSYNLTIPVIPDYNAFPGSAVNQGSESLSKVFHQLDIGPWVQASLTLPHGIKIVPGLRFDYYHVPGGDREDLEPRLVLRWALTEQAHRQGVHRPVRRTTAGRVLRRPVRLSRADPAVGLAVLWRSRVQDPAAPDRLGRGLLQRPFPHGQRLPRTGGSRPAALQQRRDRASLRPRGLRAPRLDDPALRLAVVHVLARRIRRRHEPALGALRLRRDPHPDGGGQLHHRLGLHRRRALPAGQRDPDDPHHRLDVRRRRGRLHPVCTGRPIRLACRSSSSSMSASTRSSPSTPGSSICTSTSGTSPTPPTRRGRFTTTATGSS